MLIVLAMLVAVATGLGLLYRTSRSRVGRVKADAPVEGVQLGTEGTLLQFSSTVCSACAATRRILGEISTENPTLTHVEVNVVDRPDLVDRFGILQTPTTLILDSSGVPVSRIGGGVRREVVLAELGRVLTLTPAHTR